MPASCRQLTCALHASTMSPEPLLHSVTPAGSIPVVKRHLKVLMRGCRYLRPLIRRRLGSAEQYAIWPTGQCIVGSCPALRMGRGGSILTF